MSRWLRVIVVGGALGLLPAWAGAEEAASSATPPATPPPAKSSAATEPAQGLLDAQALLEAARASYAALQSYRAEGRVTTQLGPRQMEHQFSLKLARPARYRIEWSNIDPLGRPYNGGAVWNAGGGPFNFLVEVRAYAKAVSDAIALAAATGVSGGAANTIPSLFYPELNPGSSWLSKVTQAKFERMEEVEGRLCYVLSGATPVFDAVTVWIEQDRKLFRKVWHSLKRPPGAEPSLERIGQMTDAQLDESVKAMGLPPTEESRARVRAMMDMARGVSGLMKQLEGGSTEVHREIVVNEAFAEGELEYTVPAGISRAESLFGGLLGSGSATAAEPAPASPALSAPEPPQP